VLATTDGGVTWSATESLIADRFLRVDFVDAWSGWVLGTLALRNPDGSFIDNRDVILHTTDRGSTWVEQRRTEHHGERYTSLDFLSRTLGWVEGGDLRRTRILRAKTGARQLAHRRALVPRRRARVNRHEIGSGVQGKRSANGGVITPEDARGSNIQRMAIAPFLPGCEARPFKGRY
jgi:hypothetical protein